MKRTQSDYDLAYGSFLVCGLTALIISAIGAIPMDSTTAAGLGFLVAIPLFVASLGAMVVGVVQCVRLWKHWPLVILSGMSVLFIVELFTEYGSTAFYNAAPVVYGVGVVAISSAWFLVLRRRQFPAAVKD